VLAPFVPSYSRVLPAAIKLNLNFGLKSGTGFGKNLHLKTAMFKRRQCETVFSVPFSHETNTII